MKHLTCSLLASVITLSLVSSVYAAKVPEGTKLAEKQEVIRGNGAEPATLDPQKNEGVPESNILRDLFEGLATTDENGKIRPAVAESWENKDNKVFTFKLRKDAKWSNGDPLTANDFVYGFQRVVDPKTASPYASFMELAHITNAAAITKGEKPVTDLGVKALDDHTLEVTLDTPVPYFLIMTAHTTMYPAHKGVIEKFGDKWTAPENFVGNGAYKIANWVVNEKLELVRNENYWDNANTVINKVTYLPIESQVTDMNRFLAGETTMTYEMPNEHFKRLQKEQPASVKVTPYLCAYYYEFNTKKPPFDNVKVRQALSYAINREVIADSVVSKGEKPAYIFTHQNTAGFKPEFPEYSKLTQAERDAKAKELLTEAGFGADKPLSFTLLYNTSDNHKKIALAVSSMWKKALGVEVKLENQEWKTFLDTRRNSNYDVSRAGWCGDYNEASTFLTLLKSDNPTNYGKYVSAEYDQLLADAIKAPTDDDRNAIYNKAEAVLTKDVPIAPTYHYVNARLVKPNLGGYPMNNAEDKIYTKDLYLIAE